MGQMLADYCLITVTVYVYLNTEFVLFTYTHSEPSQKWRHQQQRAKKWTQFCDVRMTLAFALEQAFLKPTNSSCFCAPLSKSKVKQILKFPKRFSNVYKRQIDFRHLLEPSVVVKTFALQTRVSTPPSGSSRC